MNPQASEREDLPIRDRRWVEALRARAPDGPPPALDAAILGEALRAVAPPQAERASRPVASSAARPARWMAAVAGVMVLFSAGVLVRQVALETAPGEPMPELQRSPAAETRAEVVEQSSRAVEETLPEAAAPAALAAPPVAARAPGAPRASSTSARDSGPPVPTLPSEPTSARPLAEASVPTAASAGSPAAPAAAPVPVASADGPQSKAASAPMTAPVTITASEATAPTLARQHQAAEEVGRTTDAQVADRSSLSALPDAEDLEAVRALLQAGDVAAARERLLGWRQRHPDAVLPEDLAALLEEFR